MGLSFKKKTMHNLNLFSFLTEKQRLKDWTHNKKKWRPDSRRPDFAMICYPVWKFTIFFCNCLPWFCQPQIFFSTLYAVCGIGMWRRCCWRTCTIDQALAMRDSDRNHFDLPHRHKDRVTRVCGVTSEASTSSPLGDAPGPARSARRTERRCRCR